MSETTGATADFVNNSRSPETFTADTRRFPWLATTVEVPASVGVIQGAAPFLFASLVGKRHALRKIAGRVSDTEYAKAQDDWLVALPFLLSGKKHPKVQDFPKDFQPKGGAKLFETHNLTSRGMHIAFALESTESGLPIVVRTAVYRTDDKPKVEGIFTGRTSGRRKATNQYKKT